MAGLREVNESFAHGARRITLERYEPLGEGPFPTVLLLHGRDGLTWADLKYRPLARELADHGFAVFLVHYFGAPRPERDATDERQFLGWIERVRAALTYAAAQLRVDAGRLGLVGISLGGYLALAVAARDSRVRAVVECCGGLPEPVVRELRRMPPVLVLHGTDDAVVPVAEADRVERLLTEKGLSCEKVLYPGEGHELGPVAALDAARRTLSFLQRHLDKTASPSPP